MIPEKKILLCVINHFLFLFFFLAFGEMIKLLDDHGVSSDGIAVYEAAYKVTRSIIRWNSCL